MTDGNTDAINRRIEELEAMLPAAYRAGVEASAEMAAGYYRENTTGFRKSPDRSDMGRGIQRGKEQAARDIRALPTPTIEQLKAMTKESGDE